MWPRFSEYLSVGAFKFKPVCPVFAAKLHKSFIWTIKGWAPAECWPRCSRLTPSSQLLTMKGRGGPHTKSAGKETWGIWFSSLLSLYFPGVPRYLGSTLSGDPTAALAVMGVWLFALDTLRKVSHHCRWKTLQPTSLLKLTPSLCCVDLVSKYFLL